MRVGPVTAAGGAAEAASSILRVGNNDVFAALTAVKFPLHGLGAGFARVFPVVPFALLRAELRPAILLVCHFHVLAAADAVKFPNDSCSRYMIRPGLRPAAMIGIAPTGSTAVDLGHPHGRKRFAADFAFPTHASMDLPQRKTDRAENFEHAKGDRLIEPGCPSERTYDAGHTTASACFA